MTKLLDRIEQKSIPEPNSGCWIWIGDLNKNGYASLYFEGKTRRAHRILYEHVNGPVPTGLVLDHKCRVRCCVNPDHLEAVTQKINVLRGIGPTSVNAAKTHCVHGHPFEGENLKYKGTWRACRICDLASKKRNYYKNKGVTQ